MAEHTLTGQKGSNSGWDPMKEDFQDSGFNSYVTKSGVNLASQKGDNGMLAGVTLYVSGIPSNLTREALQKMFSQVGEVISVSYLKQREDFEDSYGFVKMATVLAAERAIQKFDNMTFSSGRYRLTVEIARSRDDRYKKTPQQPSEVPIQWSETNYQQLINQSSLCCIVCQKQASKRCQRCKAPYCSRECQQLDWPKHKQGCLITTNVAEKGIHHTPSSRTPVSHSDGEFEKHFEVSAGKELATIVAEELTRSKNLADDVSNIIIRNEDTKVTESESHHQLQDDKVQPSNVKNIQLEGQLKVVITSFTNPSDFWVVSSTSLTSLAELQDELNKFYMNTRSDNNFTPQQGVLCVGEFSIDKHWYRCQIDYVLDDEVAVRYVDYGNAEIIPITSTRQIDPGFTHFPLQAVHCSLCDVKQVGGRWSLDAVKHTSALMPVNSTMDVIVRQQDGNSTAVDVITADGTPVGHLLVDKGFAENVREKIHQNRDIQPEMIQHTFRSAKSNSSQVEFKSLKEASSEKERVSPFTSSQKELLSTEQHFSKPVIKTVLDKLEVGETITVEVKVSKSPSEFWAQISTEQSITELQKLTSLMNSCYSQLQANPYLVSSTLYACYSLDDKKWYRAKLLEILEKTCMVFYVDYGKKDVLQHSFIHPLQTSHYELPLQALTCSLADVCGTKPDGSWHQNAIDLFSEKTAGNVLIKLVSKSETSCQVVLMLPDESTLNELLVKRQLAVSLTEQIKCQEPSSEGHSDIHNGSVLLKHVGVTQLPALSCPVENVMVTVVYAPNMNRIVVQQMSETCVDFMVAVHQVMDHFQPTPSISQPVVGDLVAARYSQDGKWYRAEVKSILSPLSFQVYFIDYGNEEELSKSSIAAIPESMYKYPALGIKCSLTGIKEVASWNPGLLENQIFKMMIISLNNRERADVQLFNSATGCAVTDQLIEIGYAARTAPEERTSSPGNTGQRLDNGVSSPKITASKLSVDLLEEKLSCRNMKEKGKTSCIMSSDIPYQSVYSNEIVAATVYYVNCMEFYIICATEELITATRNLTLQLQTRYSKNVEVNIEKDRYQPVVGELVAAYCTGDQSWYRAEVLKCNATAIEVLYTEFGNKETVSGCHVHQLKPEFAELPKQALKCHLREELTFTDEYILKIAIQDKIFTYKLYYSEGQFTVADILASDSKNSLINEMVDHGFATIKKSNKSPTFTNDSNPKVTAALGRDKNHKQSEAWVSSCFEEDLDPKRLWEENRMLKDENRILRLELSDMKKLMEKMNSN